MLKRTSKFAKREINSEIRRLEKVHTGKTNHYGTDSVIADLAKFKPQFDQATFENRQKDGWARREYSRYERSHRPTLKADDQGSLLPCDGLIPVAKKVRIWLHDATDDDVTSWLSIEAQQHARNTMGGAQNIALIELLMRTKREYRQCKTYGQFFKERNGWVPQEEDEALLDDDDDTDGGEE